jgi:DNA replication and repair protein RecF
VRLQNLYLENFRNFSKIEVNFSAGTNILAGDNAQGKTNLIESIYFLAYSKSYRTSSLSTLLKQGYQISKVSGLVDNDSFTKELTIIIDDNVKKLYVEKKSVDLRDYLGNLQIVLYEPFTLIFSGLPRERRRYIDRAIVNLDRKYLLDIANYNRVLQQRNLLIKSRHSEREEEIWDGEFIKYAIPIWKARFEYLQKLGAEVEKLKEIFFRANDEIEMGLKTVPPLSTGSEMWAEEIKNHLSLLKQKEKQIGYTLLGPHRDDLVIMMNSMDMKLFASSGQLKAILILMTLAHINIFYSVYGEYPILICDDVDTELDEQKRKSFLSALKPGIQVFLTTTNKDLSKMVPDAELFMVKEGSIYKESNQ